MSTIELQASVIPAGATLVYRGQEHKVDKVRVLSKWVQFTEPEGHVIYRRVGSVLRVKATPKTKALVSAA